MKNTLFSASTATGVLALFALTTVPASASCGQSNDSSKSNPAAYASALRAFGRMKAKARAIHASHPDDTTAAAASIIGFWHTVFLVDPEGGYSTAGPNVFDEGFDSWHSDGTETLNDISPPPTGNVCMGVWNQTG